MKHLHHTDCCQLHEAFGTALDTDTRGVIGSLRAAVVRLYASAEPTTLRVVCLPNGKPAVVMLSSLFGLADISFAVRVPDGQSADARKLHDDVVSCAVHIHQWKMPTAVIPAKEVEDDLPF